MSALPPFLAALGVDDPAADERTLRRAYAKRLKQIDVEADPAGFQALRENLERALSWAAWQARQRQATADPGDEYRGPATVDAPEPAVPPAVAAAQVQAPSAPALPDFRVLGEAVFAELLARLADGLSGVDRARELLDQAFADTRLVNVDARLLVEARVTALLASGWRPGHEHLLVAAAYLFDWERDHGRLAPFGPAGMVIAGAMRERLGLERLPQPELAAVHQALADVRRREMSAALQRPEAKVGLEQLRLEAGRLQLLLERAPTWLRLVAPMPMVQARIACWHDVSQHEAEGTAVTPSLAHGPSARWSGPPRGGKEDRKLVRVLLGCVVAVAAITKIWPVAVRPAPANALPLPRLSVTEAPANDADLARRQQDAEALLRQALAASAPGR